MELSDKVLEWYALRILNIFDSSYVAGPPPSDLPEKLYLRFIDNPKDNIHSTNPFQYEKDEEEGWAALYDLGKN